MKSWLSHLKGLDSSIPHHLGKGAKIIVIHHDADGDDDGTYEKFEININDPEDGSEKTNTTENDSITGGKYLQGSGIRTFEVIRRNHL